ncbi:MAG: NTP transferase domain-containing protein [Puniceicoccales bacterium]|jgi:glucose-1-phosphate adenylyltransferase|nr:NTP transferase domain-containing protein [Puniceicoccales bacterium]
MRGDVHCVIMGGGRGDRLYPLTKTRCKPAVPLAGKYRLVDIPISNCLNAGFSKIYILTQFNTRSLHRHIETTYRFDTFGNSSIEIFSAEQTNSVGEQWYAGTADAVRKNLKYINHRPDDTVLVLSGDQLYRMNLADFVARHRNSRADVTIATKTVPEGRISEFGIALVDDSLKISDFVEKPNSPGMAKHCVIGESIRKTLRDRSNTPYYLASMGIYAFTSKKLEEVLSGCGSDFGRDILPGMLGKYDMRAYVFDGFWEDIGTVRSFFETNLMLTDVVPEFDFFDAENPIYTRARYLPACKVNSCQMEKTLLSDGCIITSATLVRCVIGLRSVIGRGTYLENVLMFGADYFDCQDSLDGQSTGRIPLGIGENSVIKNAIIDKDARIGSYVHLTPYGKPDGCECNGMYVKDGILCIARNAEIPDNTVF